MDKHETEKCVMGFLNSNSPMDHILWDKDEFSSAKAACAPLRRFIKKRRLPVRVMMSKGKVYLVRE